MFEKGYCENDQEYLECLCSHEPMWDDLLSDKSLPLANYITAFQSAKK